MKNLCAALLILAALAVSVPVKAGVPGGVQSASAVLGGKQTVDGTGLAWASGLLGYKTYCSTSTTAQQVIDEYGNAAQMGMVHSVYTSSGSATADFAVVYDTTGAGGGAALLTAPNIATATSLGVQLTVPISALTTGAVTITPDAQFNWGLYVLQTSSTTGRTTCVEWRPRNSGDH